MGTAVRRAIYLPCGKSDIPTSSERYCASRSDIFASQMLWMARLRLAIIAANRFALAAGVRRAKGNTYGRKSLKRLYGLGSRRKRAKPQATPKGRKSLKRLIGLPSRRIAAFLGANR